MTTRARRTAATLVALTLTVAGLLRAQGYHTACIGKWHLGMTWARKPDTAAFEAKDAKDLRGAPVWDLPRWKERT